MSKNVKLNDVEYTGVSKIQLETTDGGTAEFQDVDEITTDSGNSNGVEVGTIVGDGTNSVTIPVASLKSNCLIYADTENIENVDATGYGVLAITVLDGVVRAQVYMNSTAVTVTAAAFPRTVTNKISANFTENSIVITTKASGGANEKFVSGHTYHWMAW